MAIAISPAPPSRLTNLQPLWHQTAPRRLVDKCPAEDPLVGWTAWQKYLARRNRPPAPPFLRGKRPPIRWGWPDGSPWSCATGAAIAEAGTSDFHRTTLTEPVSHGGIDLADALRTVELAYKLPSLASELPGDAWWQLMEQLHETAASALAERIEWPGDPRQALRSQLLAGELPLALSYLFPEIRSLRELRTNAHTALSESLEALTDGRGLPHARLLPVFAPLFACWTRVRWLGARMKPGCWSSEAEYQYRWLVQQALRLVDANGQFMLVPPGAALAKPWPKDLFATALELVGTRKLFAAAKAALPKRVTPHNAYSSAEDLPARSLESDWSGIAVLSEGWSRSDTRLALAFADDPVRIELTVGRDKLFVGDWTCETTCDGTPVRVAGEWEELSWESDKRSDYIELGVDLTEGLRLERQLLLARDDSVLFLADTLLSSTRVAAAVASFNSSPARAGCHLEARTRDARWRAGCRQAPRGRAAARAARVAFAIRAAET